MAELTKEQQVRYTEVLVDASDEAVKTWGGGEDMMVLASRYNAAMATAVALAARDDVFRRLTVEAREDPADTFYIDGVGSVSEIVIDWLYQVWQTPDTSDGGE